MEGSVCYSGVRRIVSDCMAHKRISHIAHCRNARPVWFANSFTRGKCFVFFHHATGGGPEMVLFMTQNCGLANRSIYRDEEFTITTHKKLTQCKRWDIKDWHDENYNVYRYVCMLFAIARAMLIDSAIKLIRSCVFIRCSCSTSIHPNGLTIFVYGRSEFKEQARSRTCDLKSKCLFIWNPVYIWYKRSFWLKQILMSFVEYIYLMINYTNYNNKLYCCNLFKMCTHLILLHKYNDSS